MSNKICDSCQKECKQTTCVQLVVCPKYVAKPIQMELKFKNQSTKHKST